MANTHNLFQVFCTDLKITDTKDKKLDKSRENLRITIKNYFKKNHPNYKPEFWTQGSYKMRTMIRTKDDTCDIDDGVYFKKNPDKISCTKLQGWVKNAVDDITDSSASHKKMCITVDYKAGYNIDLPVYMFYDEDNHPSIAVKNEDWREDDPKEMVEAFKVAKKGNFQLIRIVKYLKAWCDHKRAKMPSGLAMTILAINNHISNVRDDVSLKFTLIEIERALKPVDYNFRCEVPATPHDDVFNGYETTRRDNFMHNIASFIKDAKDAVDDEKNSKKASELWRKHLGDRFPFGKDENEKSSNAEMITPIIGNSKPYAR